MRKLFAIKLAAILVLVLTSTGCPSKSQIDRAAGASRELAHDTRAAEKTVRTLFLNGRLSLQKKDFFAEKLGFIAREGKKFNDFVIKLNEQEKAGTLPANAAQLINQNFAAISEAFSDLMAEIGKLPEGEAKELTSSTHDLSEHVSAIKEIK